MDRLSDLPTTTSELVAAWGFPATQCAPQSTLLTMRPQWLTVFQILGEKAVTSLFYRTDLLVILSSTNEFFIPQDTALKGELSWCH